MDNRRLSHRLGHRERGRRVRRKSGRERKNRRKTGTFRYRMTETDEKLLIVFVDCSRDTQNVESEWTESIHHQTERLTSLVTQLLTLAKMDEGGGQLEQKEWNASETIIDAVQSFEAPAVTKQITLQTDIAKELRMEGDAARIHQLVSLLVDNAVKYTPEGGTIRVR